MKANYAPVFLKVEIWRQKFSIPRDLKTRNEKNIAEVPYTI